MTDLRKFARGGYATIYRATQISVDREVAIKVENRALGDERDRSRFLREARAASRMSSHPHVVDLFDVGVTADGHPYLVMELCEGSYANRTVAPAQVRGIGIKIADALADSHNEHVLHRDVKPANILHSKFNEAVLADFGLAVLAEMRDPNVTLEVLTPAYAPPEMFRASRPSAAVDVYALSATLYAMLRGKPPRWKDDRNPSLLTIVDMFNQPIPDLPGVPEPLIAVLRKGMANEPERRPSAAELRDMLYHVEMPNPGTNPYPNPRPDPHPTPRPDGRPDNRPPRQPGRVYRGDTYTPPRAQHHDPHPTQPNPGFRSWFRRLMGS